MYLIPWPNYVIWRVLVLIHPEMCIRDSFIAVLMGMAFQLPIALKTQPAVGTDKEMSWQQLFHIFEYAASVSPCRADGKYFVQSFFVQSGADAGIGKDSLWL